MKFVSFTILHVSFMVQVSNKIQEENTNEFRLKWNNYKNSDKKSARNLWYMQEHFVKQFNSEGHSGFHGKASLALIYKAVQ